MAGIGLAKTAQRIGGARALSQMALAGMIAAGASAAPAAAEQLPNGFATAEIGQSTLYDTERGPRLYVYAGPAPDGPNGAGYLEEVFQGCDAFVDAAQAGRAPTPVARHWFDASGELVRSEWDDRFVALYEPHGCLVTLGACAGVVRYRGWLDDPQAAETYAFTNNAAREGDRVTYDYAEFAASADGGPTGPRVARTTGWFDVGAGGQFGDGESYSTRDGEAPAARWHRRLAGPASVDAVCGGVS